MNTEYAITIGTPTSAMTSIVCKVNGLEEEL